MSTTAHADAHTLERLEIHLERGRTPPQAEARCSCGWTHTEDAKPEDGSMQPVMQRAEDAHAEHANPPKDWNPTAIRDAAETIRRGGILTTSRPADQMPQTITRVVAGLDAGELEHPGSTTPEGAAECERIERVLLALGGWDELTDEQRRLAETFGAELELAMLNGVQPAGVRLGLPMIHTINRIDTTWISITEDEHGTLLAGIRQAIAVLETLHGADQDELEGIRLALSELRGVQNAMEAEVSSDG